LALAVAVPCWVLLVTAFCLHPRTAGYGTAGELGLPACGTLARTGYPCPTCGMTTSVAAAVRGRLAAAWKAHPFGPFLAAAAILLAVTSTVQLVTGRDLLRSFRLGWWWVLAAAAGMLAGWLWMLATGVAEGKWPIR